MPGSRVLVLEHHRDLREILVEALLDEGYVVTPAPTQEAALVALHTATEGQLPDVAVVDAHDGLDLIGEVRSSERYDHVALVSLSFAFDPPTQADVDVRRPFRLEVFLDAVRDALVVRARAPDRLPPASAP